MSRAEVTRAGLRGIRPGREAKVWSRGPTDHEPTSPHTHPGASYYGQPIINPPVWHELDIAGYLFAGGLAGASSILAAGGDLTGRPELARRCKLCATGALGVSLAALIRDLGRPARFLNMLRVFKPTSPMNMGAWLLGVYGPLNVTTCVSDTLDVAPTIGRAASVGAGLFGAGLSCYTAALIADTAVPVWHEGRRELPFLFAGSAAAAGAGFALVAAPPQQAAPARRMAILGAATELAAGQLMQRRLGLIAEALHEGNAAPRLRAAKALSAAGTLAVALRPRSRPMRVLGGAALMAGSALTRFGLFEAGMVSARDPRYTVQPQRERLAAANTDPHAAPTTRPDERTAH